MTSASQSPFCNLLTLMFLFSALVLLCSIPFEHSSGTSQKASVDGAPYEMAVSIAREPMIFPVWMAQGRFFRTKEVIRVDNNLSHVGVEIFGKRDVEGSIRVREFVSEVMPQTGSVRYIYDV